MEGLVTFLLLAGGFYLVMRFACGSHMVHGHATSGAGERGDGGHHAATAPHRVTAATDPVCGMEIAPGQGYTTTYVGREYRLCSRACLDRFEADPEMYASNPGGAP